MAISVVNHVSLDGVMQAPARADEDVRDGFAQGGWAIPGNDEVMGREMGRRMGSGDGAMLLGRRTYEDFAQVWPAQPESPYARKLEATPKYVVSSTLSEPLPWANSHVLGGPLGPAVRAAHEREGDLSVLGSGALIAGLMAEDLVDEWLVLIHPVVLGHGRRLFGGGVPARLALTDTIVTGTGVIMASYRRA